MYEYYCTTVKIFLNISDILYKGRSVPRDEVVTYPRFAGLITRWSGGAGRFLQHVEEFQSVLLERRLNI